VDHSFEEPPAVKADPFVQLRLLDLQALDSALDRLAHKRKTLPALAEIDRRDGLVAARHGDVVLAEATVSDLQRELDKAEADIEQVRVRRARDEDRLGSGAITVPKQLEELQHEVATLSKRQSDLEDAELEVMERMEEAQKSLDGLLGERTDNETARAAAVVERDAGWAEIDAETTRTQAERAAVATEIPADLLALYEKIRAAEGGLGAGPIERGRCGACRLDLMQNEKAEYRAAPVDEVLRHECRRILVRTPESGL
jgi:predicted  nucleic acid-binding Zn-ribbon protein